MVERSPETGACLGGGRVGLPVGVHPRNGEAGIVQKAWMLAAICLSQIKDQVRARQIGANPEKSDLVNFPGPD